jgi:snapalysin
MVFEVANGWPEANTGPGAFGQGTITIGRQTLDEGHSVYRIVAHEFGHILGLDDRRGEGCSSVMSGHKGGNDCQNTAPDTYEKRKADSNFAGQ